MKQLKYFFIKIILFTLLNTLFWSTSFAHLGTEGIQVYQKNMHLSEEHKQKLAADIYRYYKADNIWDALRHEFVLPHYEYMPQVQEQINWFLMHPDFLQQSATRAAPYLYYILQQVRKRHLPAELVLLPMMESSYNPFAYSTVGAAGIWQIMPETATGFGIKQNWWYDGRRDVMTSTRAALDYVAYLGSYFGGNWLLAIAAYDTGEGNILSAIKKNIRNGKSTDYWSLPLSQETRIYIPRLLALATIISYPDRYPVLFPPVRNAPYLAQIDIGGQIDLKHAATLAGLSLKKLMQLNPGYNRSATDPDGPFKLLLPIEHVQRFTQNLDHSPSYPSIRKNTTSNAILASQQPALFTTSRSRATKTSWPLAATKPHPQLIANETPAAVDNNTIGNALANLQGRYALQPGDTLYMIRQDDDLPKIAKRFHINTNTLLAVNQLTSQSRLQPGEKIIIPTHLAQPTTTQPYELTSSETIYSVKQNETIDNIAQRFHTTPNAIRIANLLTTNTIKTGDRLVIPQIG